MDDRFKQMQAQVRSFVQDRLDPVLLFCMAALTMIALLALYSAGPAFFLQGLRNCVVGVILMIIFANMKPQTYVRLAPLMYLLALVLLMLVFGMGDVSRGAKRWLNLGVVRIQPSELMKIAMPLMLAWFFHIVSTQKKVWHFLIAAVLLLLPTLLVLKQPDLGTGILILSSGLVVLFLAGLSWRIIILFVCIGIILMPFSCSTPLPHWWPHPFLHDYQCRRLMSFMNPMADPHGAGYHTIQSMIAIGSGGLTGKGWLHGTQIHLQFVPERHTDFIFAAIGEEFGLWGCTFLILLYTVLIFRGMSIALHAPDVFSRLLSGTMAFLFFIYAFVNIGMVTGLLPVVGVPLPLISYGGSAMMTLFVSIGMLMSIHKHRYLVSS